MVEAVNLLLHNPEGVLFAGLCIAVLCWIGRYRLKKYEFENMSDGGVVGFSSFEKSLAHNGFDGLLKFLEYIGGVLSALGLIVMIIKSYL